MLEGPYARVKPKSATFQMRALPTLVSLQPVLCFNNMDKFCHFPFFSNQFVTMVCVCVCVVCLFEIFLEQH